MIQEASMRETYGKTVAELGKENPDIVVLDADLSKSTQTFMFGNVFPDRFFDVGIAEQNLIGIAAGLAHSGKIPFASSFAVFIPGRCFDQVRMSVAQPHLNVKLVTTHGGISVGEDGSSHHAIEDLAMALSLPGFTVIVPADAVETAQVIRFAAKTTGPFYIRLCRPRSQVVFGSDYQFQLSKAPVLREGRDATIIAIGLMVPETLKAADNLKNQGINSRVLNMSSLKPIDETAIIQAAKETGAIITAEEHLLHGGLGARVAEVVARNQPVPIEFVALNDTYARSGKAGELMARYGLTAKDIEQKVKEVLKRKAK
ncbi:MAG: transketolase family protein [Chloroflexota bacterium]